MAQQKSEDRVLLEGGVMPVERAGSGAGGQGKAVPVDETTGQLCLPIATAERRARVPDRSGMGRPALPKAIVNAQIDTSVTMEGVVSRLTSALMKGASNKGLPVRMGRRSRRCVSGGRSCCPGCRPTCWRGGTNPARFAGRTFPRREVGSADWGFPTWWTGWSKRPCDRCSILCQCHHGRAGESSASQRSRSSSG